MAYWRRPTRRVLELVPEDHAWHDLSEQEHVALFALEHHLRFRLQQREQHEAFELVDGVRCGVFLTPKHVQRLLRDLRYRKTGIKFAAEIIRTLIALDVIEQTEQPRRTDRAAGTCARRR